MARSAPHREQVPARVVAYAVVAAAALLVTLLLAHGRETRELPAATAALRLAVIEAGEVVECLNGIQDDLYVDAGGTVTPGSARAARERLALCELRPLERHLESIALSPPAPVTTDRNRRAHAAALNSTRTLERLVLDVRGTRRLMAGDIRAGTKSTAVLVGYTAAEAGFRRANALLSEAEALLDPGA